MLFVYFAAFIMSRILSFLSPSLLGRAFSLFVSIDVATFKFVIADAVASVLSFLSGGSFRRTTAAATCVPAILNHHLVITLVIISYSGNSRSYNDITITIGTQQHQQLLEAAASK